MTKLLWSKQLMKLSVLFMHTKCWHTDLLSCWSSVLLVVGGGGGGGAWGWRGKGGNWLCTGTCHWIQFFPLSSSSLLFMAENWFDTNNIPCEIVSVLLSLLDMHRHTTESKTSAEKKINSKWHSKQDLTLSLPQCYLKMTNKSAKFNTLLPPPPHPQPLTCKRIHIKTRSINNNNKSFL